MDNADEIKELEDFIIEARRAYYDPNDNTTDINDDTYDAALAKLGDIDINNKVLKEVGADDSKEFSKVEHIMTMHSQQKASNWKEFAKWVKKGYLTDSFFVQHKLDGMSIELQYKNGKLYKAVTRGKYETNMGDDITENVLKMKNITIQIKNFNGAVRGEIVMTEKMYKKKYSHKKNPRNTATGLAKRPDGVGCEDLIVIVYDVYPKFTKDHILFDTEEKKIVFLEKNFETFVTTYESRDIYDIKKLYEEYGVSRLELPISIDGLVIKPNTVDYIDIKRKQPMKQIALKFPVTEVITTIRYIEWSFKGSICTPVAIFDKINISGSDVERASLANHGLMFELGLRIGSLVAVSKRGEIIPKIERVIVVGNGPEIEIPTNCEICNSFLIRTDKKLYCDNKECKNKLLHQLNKWIKVNDIKHFGKGMVKTLYSTNTVKSISDFYNLDISIMENLTGSGGNKIGKLNSEKALINLNSKRCIHLNKFIAGFDITNISEKIMSSITIFGYDTLEKIRDLNIQKMMEINGVGEKKASFLIDGLIENYDEMNELLKYVTIESPDENLEISDKLDNKNYNVVFSGTLSIGRKEATSMVEKYGGKVKSTITKKITYLVTPDINNKSSKNIKAIKLGIEIIDEKTFMSIFG